MANYSDGPYVDRIAGADLSGLANSQANTTCLFRIVKQQADATNTTGRSVILASAATDKLFGVLNNQPKDGETASVRGRNSQGTFKVVIGGTVTINDLLTSDANGAAVTTTNSGDQVIGIAQESGVVGQVIEYLPANNKA
jgi:hypothetical protein